MKNLFIYFTLEFNPKELKKKIIFFFVKKKVFFLQRKKILG